MTPVVVGESLQPVWEVQKVLHGIREPEGHKLESPAVQALGRSVAINDLKAQRAVTQGHGPLGRGNLPSLSSSQGLRAPAFQADGMRFPKSREKPTKSHLHPHHKCPKNRWPRAS